MFRFRWLYVLYLAIAPIRRAVKNFALRSKRIKCFVSAGKVVAVGKIYLPEHKTVSVNVRTIFDGLSKSSTMNCIPYL